MSRFVYEARIAPVDTPFLTRIAGEGVRTIRLDASALPLANRAKVRVGHGAEDIGSVSAAIQHRGWWIADFVLDPQLVDEQTERDIRTNQPVSIGMSILRSRPDPRSPGVELVTLGDLTEISLVRRGMIEGAKITSKHPLRQVQRQVTASAAARPTARVLPGTNYVMKPGDVELPSSGVLVRRDCGTILAVGGVPVRSR